jgi:hypothetical protein
MSRAKEKTIALLSRTLLVDMDTNAKVDLYTVPAGKKAIVTMVAIHTLANATALGSNNDLGDGAQADTWKTDINLSTMDAADDYYVVSNDNVRIEAVFDAGDVFGISPDEDADSGGANTATVDVWGYEFDA